MAEARRRGVDATCETCPHYLFLTPGDVEALGAIAKCAPPVRGDQDLWGRLGDIDFVTSDHSPSSPDLKEGDFGAAWGGIAGAQTTLPLLLGEGLRRGVALDRLADLVTGAPARRFRLPGKGRLEVGADADLTLVQIGGEHPVAELRDRHRVNPFAGRRLGARVVRTLLRGREGRHGRLLVPEKRGTVT